MKKIIYFALTVLACNFSLYSQETGGAVVQKDPFKKGKAEKIGKSEVVEPKNISICYELFSLPLTLAAKLRRQDLSDTELYARMVAGVEDTTVKQEAFVIVRGRSGQKYTSESISEYIYPTEWSPPQMPTIVTRTNTGETEASAPISEKNRLESAPKQNSLSGSVAPATPTVFETKNVGLTLEFEALIGASDRFIDIRMAPQSVVKIERENWGQGVSIIEMPEFEAQRISTGLSFRVDQPHLIGTMNRPPISKVDPDSANRVWFAFITASFAKY